MSSSAVEHVTNFFSTLFSSSRTDSHVKISLTQCENVWRGLDQTIDRLCCSNNMKKFFLGHKNVFSICQRQVACPIFEFVKRRLWFAGNVNFLTLIYYLEIKAYKFLFFPSFLHKAEIRATIIFCQLSSQ